LAGGLAADFKGFDGGFGVIFARFAAPSVGFDGGCAAAFACFPTVFAGLAGAGAVFTGFALALTPVWTSFAEGSAGVLVTGAAVFADGLADVLATGAAAFAEAGFAGAFGSLAVCFAGGTEAVFGDESGRSDLSPRPPPRSGEGEKAAFLLFPPPRAGEGGRGERSTVTAGRARFVRVAGMPETDGTAFSGSTVTASRPTVRSTRPQRERANVTCQAKTLPRALVYVAVLVSARAASRSNVSTCRSAWRSSV
jgi:hypothetical protein